MTEALDKGAVVGTADYISPEQAMNSPDLDIRADIYSLGVTFFTLVTGQPPFAGNTTQKLLQHQMKDAPAVSALDKTIPPGLAAVVGKMLRKKPADRYQTPAQVIEALGPWLSGTPRVVAALSRTNLPQTPGMRDTLAGVMKASTGRLPHLPPAGELGERAARSKRPLYLGAAVGGLLLLAGAVTAAVLMIGGPSTPSVPVAANPPPDPLPPVTPPLIRLNLDAQQPFVQRARQFARPGSEIPITLVSETGPGRIPAGWSRWIESPDALAEFFADGTPGAMAYGIRLVSGPGGVQTNSPEIATAPKRVRLRVLYQTGPASPGATVRFRPKSGAIWDAAGLPATGGSWRLGVFDLDLRGATGGLFEVSTATPGADAALRLREFVVVGLAD